LLKLSTDRHEASRGLFATAELLVQWMATSLFLITTKSRSILLNGRLRTALPWRTVASSSCVISKNPLARGDAAMHQWIAFITDDDAKILKKCNIFLLIMDFAGGLLPRNLHF